MLAKVSAGVVDDDAQAAENKMKSTSKLIGPDFRLIEKVISRKFNPSRSWRRGKRVNQAVFTQNNKEFDFVNYLDDTSEKSHLKLNQSILTTIFNTYPNKLL